MKKAFGSLKTKISGKQHDEAAGNTRWSSNSSPAGPSQLVPGSQSDAPPAYSRVDPAPASSKAAPAFADAGAGAPNMLKYTNEDDPYAFLSFFDTIFIIDDSDSMSGSPWKEVADVLRSITPICTSHDKDGVDLYFLNHKSDKRTPSGKAKGGYYNINSSKKITQIFSSVKPSQLTPTGTRLWSILNPYLKALAAAKDMDDVKPINIIVITDGKPTDNLEDTIVEYAKWLDELRAPPHQVGIQFFQVGKMREAAEALQHLDDGLKSFKVRDMVDTVTWDAAGSSRTGILSADTILKVVLGAVVRRLDRVSTMKQLGGSS
ncbi:hypothetical protein V8C42DRAFT_89407 [Trichoderma barbatum]